jgi:hypothetical protein
MSGEIPDPSAPPPKRLQVEPRQIRALKDAEPTGLAADDASVQPELVTRLEAAETRPDKGPPRFEASTKRDSVAHVRPKFQARGEELDAAQVESAGWGEAGKRPLRWAILAAVGVLLAILGGWAIQPLLVDKTAVGPSFFDGLHVVDDVTKEGAAPLRYFEQNPDEVVREMGETMMRYASARTVEEVLPLIRDGERLKSQLLKSWRPWNPPAGWKSPDASVMGYGSAGDRPYAFMKGLKPNFERFQMFFVRENERMLVDWEATEGIGSHTFEELENPALKEATMRVTASPAVYYNLALSEDRYRSFQLVGADGIRYVWGYAAIGTPVEETLTRIFSGGLILDDSTPSQAVRVRLGREPQGRGQSNQWVILDVLHKGWVAP